MRASVGFVSDFRTTGNFDSQCTIEVRFTGDALSDALAVLRVRLIRAEDDLSRNLITKQPVFESSWAYIAANREKGPLKSSVYLRNPSRNAALVKVLEGEVEFFSPTAANGGLIALKEIAKTPGVPIQHAMLKKHEIEMMYLTKEAYEKKRKERSKLAATAATKAGGDSFDVIYGNVLYHPSDWSSMKGVGRLYFKDPHRRLVSTELRRADGTSLELKTDFSLGELRCSNILTALSSGDQLIATVIAPEARQSFSFKLEDIPLP